MLASAQLNDRLAFDVQSAQALRAGARANDSETLRAAAKQFEALVVGMMLKTMRDSSFAPEGDVLGGGESVKLYRDMLDQQWAQKMTTGKGFGFADMMVKAMEARGKAVSAEEMARLAQPEAEAKTYDIDPGRVGAVVGHPGAAAPAAPPVRAKAASASGQDADQSAGQDGAASAGQEAAPAKAAEATDTASESADYRQRFIDRLLPHAEKVAAETGIPARFIVAHAALETGWGRYAIRKADGSDSHNLFGVKAGSGWGGGVAAQDTTEYQHGLAVRRTENFRAYGDYTESLRDYANLIAKRYQGAQRTGGDAAAFAQSLADGGYATDPNYAVKLKGVIASVAALGA